MYIYTGTKKKNVAYSDLVTKYIIIFFNLLRIILPHIDSESPYMFTTTLS